jgi:hypothetical protein
VNDGRRGAPEALRWSLGVVRRFSFERWRTRVGRAPLRPVLAGAVAGDVFTPGGGSAGGVCRLLRRRRRPAVTTPPASGSL